MSNISIIGLGKLGSCMAAVYASKGHKVIGVDVNEQAVGAMNAHKAPVKESQLQEFISEHHSNLRATISYEDAIASSDITFIIVPTPTDSTGGFSTTYVEKACESLGKILSKKDSYHVIVLTSTVLPGDCKKRIIPVLEQASGKRCGQDFGFCYSPEFIAIGSVIHDLLYPDFFLLGAHDEKSQKIVEAFYQTVCENNAPVRSMSIASAELTKISLNSYVTMKITFANMLAELAQQIPGVNVDDVTNALGHDKRIGKHYLRSGLGYGGPCFPRDNRAFAVMATRYGIQVPYAEKTDAYNKTIVPRILSFAEKYIQPHAHVAVLGLSYKPGTALCEESQSVEIARGLAAKGYVVSVWNPAGNDHAQELLGETIQYHDSLESCVANARAVVLANWDPAFAELPKTVTRGVTVIDPWRQFTTNDFSPDISYVCYGIGL